MQEEQPLLQLIDLSKQYTGSTEKAVNGISLTVKAGEIYGFLGPNGSGKSTTIRMILQFIAPTTGDIKLFGTSLSRHNAQLRQSIGYLSGDSPMYDSLTGRQMLSYLHLLQPAVSADYMRMLEHRFNAELDKKIKDLSRGNRQKIAIIQAFMHKPRLLVLDEPTSGLDPLVQEAFYDLLRERTAEGAAVFMSSHVLSEVQKICDRVGIIRAGELINEHRIADLQLAAAQTFDIVFSSKPPLSALSRIDGVEVIVANDMAVTLHVHGPISPLLALLGKHDIKQLTARSLNLDELFMKYYRDEQASEAKETRP